MEDYYIEVINPKGIWYRVSCFTYLNYNLYIFNKKFLITFKKALLIDFNNDGVLVKFNTNK